MASNPPPDLALHPIQGKSRTVRELLTTFHLCFVALDPFTNESAWILKTAHRILNTFQEADVRVAFLVTATADESRIFLGPIAKEMLVFADPEREAVKAFGLETLPALVLTLMDGSVGDAAEGWDPDSWERITDRLAVITGWTGPVLPAPRDPGPFAGTPAAG